MRIQIFHNINVMAVGSGYDPADPVRHAYAYDDTESATPADALAAVAKSARHGAAAEQEWPYEVRTVRTGDVVAVDETYFVMLPAGNWEQIPAPAILK